MTTDRRAILLVEDEAIIALAEKMTLEQHGYRVETAANGEQAIRAVGESERIDLVLMDIDLGTGMDGTDAAKAILRDHDLPVVFLSSHTEPEVVEKTEGITSYGYIVKNSGETVLMASIRMAFRLHEARLHERDALARLSHSHDMMRYVIEHNQSALAIHDRDLNYLYVSRRYLDDYLVADQEVIGRHHYDVFPDLPQRWRDVHQRALRGEISRADEDLFVRSDGTELWTRWECRPWYENDGTIGGIVINTEVINDRRLAERKLKESLNYLESIIRTVHDGFWVLDLDGRFVDANEAYCAMLGYTRDELLALRIHDVDADDSAQDIADRMSRVRRGEHEAFSTHHRRRDGTLLDVDVSVSFLEGEEPKFVCFGRDVTARVSSRSS